MSLRVPPPPLSFSTINVTHLDAGTVLHRTHACSFGAAEFNPCKGQPSRFASFTDAVTGSCVPTLYAATSREAAAFESIFHDVEPNARKSVPLSIIETRAVSALQTKRALRLASLFSPDLKLWGMRRDQLIDTPKSTYGATVAWARAIHGSAPHLDGLIWTSRQCDPERCIVVFGDRANQTDFSVLTRRDVAGDAALLIELRGYGRRAGITIVI